MMKGIDTVIAGIKQMFEETKHVEETWQAQRIADALYTFYPQAKPDIDNVRIQTNEAHFKKQMKDAAPTAYRPIDYSMIGVEGYSPYSERIDPNPIEHEPKKEKKEKTKTDNPDAVAAKNELDAELAKNSVKATPAFDVEKALNADDVGDLLAAFNDDISAVKTYINTVAGTNIRNVSQLGLLKLWKENLKAIKEYEKNKS